MFKFLFYIHIKILIIKIANNIMNNKKKYTILSLNEKIEIIRYAENNKQASDTNIAEFFSREFNKPISRRTVNDIKKQEAKIIDILGVGDKNKCKKSVLKYDDIDRELTLWVDQLELKGAIVNDELIKNKAIKIALKNNHKNFKASNGWLTSFKSRHGLKLRKLHGESFSSVDQTENGFLDDLKAKILEYGSENVYNADETGIFYKLIPSKAICKNLRNGYKLLKDRISLLLCVNMTGTDKLKPLVIGKYAKPRCFKNFSPQSIIDYTYSKRAWMTSQIFNKWLLDWDLLLEKSNKNILLVVDNCPSHKVTVSLKKIEILFIPPNRTSVYQPLDQGIIKCVKTFFNGKNCKI